MKKNYIIIYALDFPLDVWEQYCYACEVDVSATAIKISFCPKDIEAV